MTTISPNRRRTNFLRSRMLLWVVAALCLFVVATFFRDTLRDLLWETVAPLTTLFTHDNNTLNVELASTTARLADHDALVAENTYLKTLLGRSNEHHVLLAGVLLRPPGTPYDTLVIDAGRTEGVAAGMRVAAGSSVIGAVTEVYQHTAQVTLFSAPGASYQALLYDGGEPVPFLMIGQGSGSLSGEVPVQTHVARGNPVTLAGVSGGFTGTVSYIVSEPGSSFVTVFVRLPTNLFNIPFVELWRE